MIQTKLSETICCYYKEQCKCPRARGRAWDLCYGFFQENRKNLQEVRESAARHLGCYLANWGMFRSPFLREHVYTIHNPVISLLAAPRFAPLWQRGFVLQSNTNEFVEMIMDLIHEVESEYKKIMGNNQQKKTDTLVTKVLLGTVGCLPARDRYFEAGFKAHFKPKGIPYGSSINQRYIETIFQFCIAHQEEMANLKHKILDLRGSPYPIMKLVDMYFWQSGKSR